MTGVQALSGPPRESEMRKAGFLLTVATGAIVDSAVSNR
jgi:hypothetical protein